MCVLVSAAGNLGDKAAGSIIDFKFSTQQATGAPITLAGTPAVSVYKANGTTESTTGITLTVDFDSRTGLHNVRIDTSDAFYAVGNEFDVVITTGTVDSVSVVGQVIAHFSLSRQAQFLRTATAQAGAAGTITLDASASAVDDFYNDRWIVILQGTGAGQARLISDYVGSTKVASINPNWATTPDSTSVFAVLAAGRVVIGDATLGSGTFAASAITRAALAADTGLQTIRSGTAQAGAAGTITLDASASAVNDFYNHCQILLTGGTGVGQLRLITDYNGTTKVATIGPNWATTPDATSTFAIQPQAGATIWDRLFEGSVSIIKAFRRVYSYVAGKLSGAGTGTEVFRDSTDTVNRCSTSADASGNRTAVAFDDTET